MRSGTPVVLTDVPLVRPLVGTWSFDYLAENYAGPPGLNVHVTPRSTTRFSRFYGHGVGKGGILGMSFRQFVQAVRRNESAQRPPWRHYMQSTLLWGRDGACKSEKKGEQEIGGSLRAGTETLDHAPFATRIASDLESLDWAWLERMCALGGCEGLSEANLWAGASGGCTPLHYDTTSNFLCQVSGRKRLLLFNPSESAKLYPYPCEHPANAFSMIDVEQPDLTKFPSCERARGLEATLEPGDCLWLPSYVWHYVKQFEGDETLSLNFWVGRTRDTRADRMLAAEKIAEPPSPEAVDAAAAAARDAFGRSADGEKESVAAMDDALMASSEGQGLLCMQLGRHVEREARNAVSGDATQPAIFLSALAAGAELRWAAESPGRLMAAQVRSHLISLLGAETANALLRGLARDGRLHPGLAPKLSGEVVGTHDHAFTSGRELQRWLRRGADPEALRSALL